MVAQLETPKPEFEVGQAIAFIYNREDCVSGKVLTINPDGTYDIEANIPTTEMKLKWKGRPGASDYTRERVTELIPRLFLRARVGEPCAIITKQVSRLAEVIEDTAFKHKQDAVSSWQDSGQRHRVPRFHEFLAPLVGTFFDPSRFYYKVVCWRAAYQLEGQVFPEETVVFPSPSKKPFFKEFTKAFSRYFKEYNQSLGKWNRVTIIAIHPDDV